MAQKTHIKYDFFLTDKEYFALHALITTTYHIRRAFVPCQMHWAEERLQSYPEIKSTEYLPVCTSNI